MLFSHIDGLSKIQELKNKFELELETICINQSFFEKQEIKKMIKAASILIKKYPGNVVLKESEFHSNSCIYLECSFFCNKEDLNFYKEQLKLCNIKIDIIHDNITKNEYCPMF